jgi:hypothetical protein
MLTIRQSIALVFAAGALAHFSALPTVAQSKTINQVWAREQAAWRFLKAGDVENYVALFHDRFIGWPCGYPEPGNKSTLRNVVRDIRDSKAKVTYDLKLEGAQDFGDIGRRGFLDSDKDRVPGWPHLECAGPVEDHAYLAQV